jgi:hypothetical protein
MQSLLVAHAHLVAVLNIFHLLLHLFVVADAMVTPALVPDITTATGIALGMWRTRGGLAVVIACNSMHMCAGALNILTPANGGSPCTCKPFQVSVTLKPDGRP